jgi:hypothetical protein
MFENEKLTRASTLIAAAWALQLSAWFFPVEKHGVHFPQGLPGWQAFRLAACPVWPYQDWTVDGWYNAVLCTISAATTVLFLLGSIWVVRYGSATLLRATGWLSSCAFIVNAHWLLRFGSSRMDLRIGYFLWWLSFAFLSLGFLRQSSRADASDKLSLSSNLT